MENDPGKFTNLALLPENDDTRIALRQHLPKTWRYVMVTRFKNVAEASPDHPEKNAEPPPPTHTLLW